MFLTLKKAKQFEQLCTHSVCIQSANGFYFYSNWIWLCNFVEKINFYFVYVVYRVYWVYFFNFHFHLLQYNIKKKEEIQEIQPQEEPNPLMRKKKTPEELAAEAEAEDEDDFTSEFYFFTFYRIKCKWLTLRGPFEFNENITCVHMGYYERPSNIPYSMFDLLLL